MYFTFHIYLSFGFLLLSIFAHPTLYFEIISNFTFFENLGYEDTLKENS